MTEVPPSSDYRPSTFSSVTPELARAWQSQEIPRRQGHLVTRELDALRHGRPPRVYQVAAEALSAIGYAGELVVEVGCASGYYSEVLASLLGRPVSYVGVDFSQPLLRAARARYPKLPLLCGDACALPLASGVAPVLFSGCVLLHVPNYPYAIRETARVAGTWAIFHRTPVKVDPPSVAFTKRAYGVRVVEYVFHEHELMTEFRNAGLIIEDRLHVSTSRYPGVSRSVETVTYVCRKRTLDGPNCTADPCHGGRAT